MFAGIKNAAGVVDGSVKAVIAYPTLTWPLLLVWGGYAPAVIYFKYFFPWDSLVLEHRLLIIFCFILGLSYLLSFSCFVLLEQLRRIESGCRPGVFGPLAVAVLNSLKALHVTICWSVIWFVLTVIEMMLRRRDDDESEEFNAENVARTLGGFGSPSLTRAFFAALNKGVRMIAFLIFPAIAWERGRGAITRGIAVARNHTSEFAAGVILTDLAACMIFLPPAIIFIVSRRLDVEFSDWVWVTTIIYCGFAWSWSVLLEQLFTAELYLWDMKWRKEVERSVAAGTKTPLLSDVPRPSILDDIPELASTL